MQSDVTFIRAHRVSTPTMAVSTPNPNATLAAWQNSLLKFRVEADISASTPIVIWDCVQGVRLVEPTDAQMKSGMQAAFKKAYDKQSGLYIDPVPALMDAIKLPKRSVIFMHNLHRFFDTPAVIQSIANVYEPFKKSGKALVMVGPGFRFPDEISNDVYLIDEAFPSPEELKAIIQRTWRAFEVSAEKKGKKAAPLSDEVIDKSIDACRGLSSSSAEQIFSMSITTEGTVDLELLWQRKIQYIESTRGLRVHRGGEKLDDLGGLENLKKMARKLATAKRKIKAVVFMDEVDKSDVATASTDTSGTSIDALGATLSYMEEHKAIGKVLLGPPGTGKSHIARAVGNECSVLIVEMDSGAMKSKWVGESQDMIRQAYKVITAIAPSDVLFIATCNRDSSLPPEFRRRFTFGTWFLDLPNTEEKKLIWKIQMKANGIEPQELPDDTKWTGAEIRNCCATAARLEIPLTEAAGFVLPIAVSAASQVETFRKSCAGKYISASYPGPYRGPEEDDEKMGPTRLMD